MIKSFACVSAVFLTLAVPCAWSVDASAPAPAPLPEAAPAPVMPADPDLPQPLDFNFAESLVTESPFTRAVNLETMLQLTGVAYLNGRPVATVLNKQTKQSFLVTEEPNQLGWRLLAADAGTDPGNTSIEMMVGPETITMHYHSQEMNAPGDRKGKGEASSSRIASSSSDKLRPSSLLGDRGKEMYASLSDSGRDKFKELVRDRMEKHPEFTPEQNSAYAQKVFAKLKAVDTPGGKTSARTPKRKQGT